MRVRSTRALLVFLACTSWGASCVDTELSIDMQLRSASITVQPDDSPEHIQAALQEVA